MKIEYRLPFRRTPIHSSLAPEPPPVPEKHPPRIARLVALAHKLDGMVQSGVVSDYGTLARLGHVTPARLTQILALLYLSPTVQEHLLFLPAADAQFISELELRSIAREPDWNRQKTRFEDLLRSKQ
jgi:hypothetical protein